MFIRIGIAVFAVIASVQAIDDRWTKTALEDAGTGKSGFSLVESAVRFTNVLSEVRGLTNQIYMSGSGVAAGDVDGDGWCDLYICGIETPNQLFRNRGNWQFDGGTKLGPDYPTTGATFADVDGDGDLDLLVSGLSRGVRLYINDGRAGFSDATVRSGLASQSAAMTMALADIDGDGDLDLYVGNFRSSTLQDEIGVAFQVAVTNGQPVIRSINGRAPTAEERTRYSVSAEKAIVEHGEADVLYRNDGTGRFDAASWVDGSFTDEDGKPLAAPPYDWTYTAMFRDMNGDGAPDLYTCSDNTSPDRVWMNDGRGRFRALATLALRHTSLSSMGVDFADINRDGLDDIFVADMMAREHGLRHRLMGAPHPSVPPGPMNYRLQYMQNTLFLNRGDGTYAEIAQLADVHASDWSWSPVFLDVDMDGYDDLLITTGLERSLRDADARRQIGARRAKGNMSAQQFLETRRIMPQLNTPNYAFRNRGNLTFENVSDAWGFNSPAVSTGMALADFDNDGDMDVAVNVLNGPVLVYRNDCAAPRISIRLRGEGANAFGVGARITVKGGAVRQSQAITCGGRYLSGDQMMRSFAAGNLIEVKWRDGGVTVVSNVEPSHLYEIREKGSESGIAPGTSQMRKTWFTDVSDLINNPKIAANVTKCLQASSAVENSGPAFTFTNVGGIGGPWNCIAKADFDSDGQVDLVAGNWGRNTKYQHYLRRPIHVFQGDINGDGKGETIDAFEEPETGKLRPWQRLDAMARTMPWLLQRFPSYAAYSVAEMDDILGDLKPKLKHMMVTSLDSMVFLKRGDGYEPRTLPIEAQFAPVLALCVADFDEDGNQDVFLAQNFFGTDPDTACYDAGQGVLLQGDGRGNFHVLSSLESGIAIYDEQRACVACDFDGDGRTDLVVTQHGAATKLYKNQTGTRKK